MTERIPVAHGENVWRLLRTDRDQATQKEVLGMVGPAMHHLLHEAGEQFAEIDPWQIVIRTTPDGQEMHEWRIGAARPVVAVSAVRAPLGPPMPGAERVLWKRALYTGEGLPTVRVVNQPWWIIVRFWWRQDSSATSMPGYRVNSVGWHEHGPEDLKDADWLIDRAIVPLVKDPDPGGQTFGEEMGPRVLDSVKQAAARSVPWALGAVVIGVLGFALFQGIRSGTEKRILAAGARPRPQAPRRRARAR